MTFIVDSGPLVAFFNQEDQWSSWAIETSSKIIGPFVTCEAVLTETFFLLKHTPKGQQKFIEALSEPEQFSLPWSFKNHYSAVLDLYSKYKDLPASFADICILHMASTIKDSIVWTNNHHFHIYRLPGNKPIPILS